MTQFTYQRINFEDFLRILDQQVEPLLKVGLDLRLIGITIGATAVTGIISECLHWSLVHLRRYRDDDSDSAEAT